MSQNLKAQLPMSLFSNITIPSAWVGRRLDRCLRDYYAVPYVTIQKTFRKGYVRINTRKVEGSYRCADQDVLHIPTAWIPTTDNSDTSLKDTRWSDKDLQMLQKQWLLYQDNDIAVLNKPRGWAVQGGTKTHRHIDGLLQYQAQQCQTDRWLLVHRLDKDTSGVLVVAQSPQVARSLGYAFQGKHIQKTYWSVVMGTPPQPEGLIDHPLEKTSTTPHDFEKVHVRPQGQKALSHYRTIDRTGPFTWLELLPVTGRTHQLRVHCAALGTPILGDFKYGQMTPPSPWEKTALHLHARSIDLSTWARRPLVITAPLDALMQNTFQRLGFSIKNET